MDVITAGKTPVPEIKLLACSCSGACSGTFHYRLEMLVDDIAHNIEESDLAQALGAKHSDRDANNQPHWGDSLCTASVAEVILCVFVRDRQRL